MLAKVNAGSPHSKRSDGIRQARRSTLTVTATGVDSDPSEDATEDEEEGKDVPNDTRRKDVRPNTHCKTGANDSPDSTPKPSAWATPAAKVPNSSTTTRTTTTTATPSSGSAAGRSANFTLEEATKHAIYIARTIGSFSKTKETEPKLRAYALQCGYKEDRFVSFVINRWAKYRDWVKAILKEHPYVGPQWVSEDDSHANDVASGTRAMEHESVAGGDGGDRGPFQRDATKPSETTETAPRIVDSSRTASAETMVDAKEDREGLNALSQGASAALSSPSPSVPTAAAVPKPKRGRPSKAALALRTQVSRSTTTPPSGTDAPRSKRKAEALGLDSPSVPSPDRSKHVKPNTHPDPHETVETKREDRVDRNAKDTHTHNPGTGQSNVEYHHRHEKQLYHDIYQPPQPTRVSDSASQSPQTQPPRSPLVFQTPPATPATPTTPTPWVASATTAAAAAAASASGPIASSALQTVGPQTIPAPAPTPAKTNDSSVALSPLSTPSPPPPPPPSRRQRPISTEAQPANLPKPSVPPPAPTPVVNTSPSPRSAPATASAATTASVTLSTTSAVSTLTAGIAQPSNTSPRSTVSRSSPRSSQPLPLATTLSSTNGPMGAASALPSSPPSPVPPVLSDAPTISYSTSTVVAKLYTLFRSIEDSQRTVRDSQRKISDFIQAESEAFERRCAKLKRENNHLLSALATLESQMQVARQAMEQPFRVPSNAH